MRLYLGVEGSLGSVYFFFSLVKDCNSNMVLSLCIKFLMSLCRACMGNCLGFGMNFSPFLSNCFCASVRVVCFANMTNASSSLFMSVSNCGLTSSLLMVYAVSVVCICFCLCLFFFK